jgi:2-oxoglutarate ferredoxin oxidoreductase subunit delta
MAKGRVTVDEQRCKGCALCIGACPPGVLVMAANRLNARGYRPVQLIDPDVRCTGCGLCAVMCPDVCLTVYRLVDTRMPASVGPLT